MGKLCFRKEDLIRIESLWKQVEINEHSINGHIVVDVHLTNDMLITALTIGLRIRQKTNALELVEIIRGGVKEDIIGIEGTFAVAAYLNRNWLTAIDRITIGKGDSGDITLPNGKVIDVKTRSLPWHDLLMVPEEQLRKHSGKYDYYVGCNEIAEDWVRIWGYATPKDLENAEVKDFGYGPTRIIEFMKLRSIKELMQER